MSFVNTGKVAEGDVVTITILNQIKDNINAAFTGLGSDAFNPAAPLNPEHTLYGAQLETSCLSFFHRFRWLAYGSAGEIVDPSGIEDSVSLADNDVAGQPAFYDLDSLDWLTYGMYYRVEGVTWAQEFDIRI